MPLGVYLLRRCGVAEPLAATVGNFAQAAPLALLLSLLFIVRTRACADTTGVALAIASGALTSGIVYVIWYAALSKLSATRAATVVGAAARCIWRSGVPVRSAHAAPGCAFRCDSWGIAKVLTSRSRMPRT